MSGTGSQRVPEEVVRRWLLDSCEAQGVPVLVSDPRVLSDVVALIGGVGGRRPRQAERATASTLPPSEPPNGLDSGRVQAPGSVGAWADDSMVEQGTDHGVLSVQVEARPLGA